MRKRFQEPPRSKKTDLRPIRRTAIGASTPIYHTTQGLDTCTTAFHPNIQAQYVVPVTISPDDIQKIVEAVRDAVKESLREDITSSIEEKIAPLRKEIDILKTVIYDLRRQLGELEQSDRIPLIDSRVC